MLLESNAKKAKKIMDDVFGTNENDVNAANNALCLTDDVEHNKKVIQNIKKIFGKNGALVLLATALKTAINSNFCKKAVEVRGAYKDGFKKEFQASFSVNLDNNETFKSLNDIQGEISKLTNKIKNDEYASKIISYSEDAKEALNLMKGNIIEITPLGIFRKDEKGNTHVIRNTILYPLSATVSAIALPLNSGLAAIRAIQYATSKSKDTKGKYAKYKKDLAELEKQLKKQEKLLKNMRKKSIKLDDNIEIKITQQTKDALENFRKVCAGNFGGEIAIGYFGADGTYQLKDTTRAIYETKGTSTLQEQKQRFANYMKNWRQSYNAG